TPQVPNSPHENTALELPLKVVAPVFLARQKDSVSSQQKAAVDEDIPDLFFGFPQPQQPESRLDTPAAAAPIPAAPAAPHVPAQPAASKAADTNIYIWGDTSD